MIVKSVSQVVLFYLSSSSAVSAMRLLFQVFSTLFLCQYVAFSCATCVYSVDASHVVESQNIECCSAGYCVFNSLANALINVTSDVIVEISDVVSLSENVLIQDNVENVVITGRHNPTVFCSNTSAVRFVSSVNVIIEDITWQGCGYNNSDGVGPVISFNNSSEVTF